MLLQPNSEGFHHFSDATGAKETYLRHYECPRRDWPHRKESQEYGSMEVSKSHSTIKYLVLVDFIDFNSMRGFWMESYTMVWLVHECTRGFEASSSGIVDETFESSQVYNVAKLFLHSLLFGRMD